MIVVSAVVLFAVSVESDIKRSIDSIARFDVKVESPAIRLAISAEMPVLLPAEKAST